MGDESQSLHLFRHEHSVSTMDEVTAPVLRENKLRAAHLLTVVELAIHLHKLVACTWYIFAFR